MDPMSALAAAATAAQFVGACFKAVSLAYDLYSRLADVPEAIRRDVAHLEALQSIAQQVANSPELQADRDIEETLRRCAGHVDALVVLLERATASGTSGLGQRTWKAVIGINQEQKIVKLLQSLEREKSILVLRIEISNS